MIPANLVIKNSFRMMFIRVLQSLDKAPTTLPADPTDVRPKFAIIIAVPKAVDASITANYISRGRLL
jgi:hypothetical protein